MMKWLLRGSSKGVIALTEWEQTELMDGDGKKRLDSPTVEAATGRMAAASETIIIRRAVKQWSIGESFFEGPAALFFQPLI
jgi:hypothetical protein